MQLFENATCFENRTAIVDSGGAHTYGRLWKASAAIAEALLSLDDNESPQADLKEQRVTYLAPPGFEYAAVQWGIWRAGGVAVPLGLAHPPAEWQYVLDDVKPVAVATVGGESAQRILPTAKNRSLPCLTVDEILQATYSESSGETFIDLPMLTTSRRAMILYTSGTTSKPKGVVTTCGNLDAQVEMLVKAWQWTKEDCILHVLPLHHVHGIVNVLTCALYSGARCEFLSPFDPHAVWRRFAEGDLTLFMAVPTIYAKLIAAWDEANKDDQRAFSAAASAMRLMVSGSAALPVSTLERWREITGHVLLERYGMTEIGMALSNPLHGERLPGRVGAPLPGVELRRVADSGAVLDDDAKPGEIEVRGESVFSEYWDRPQATNAAFHDGWFKTGDIAVVENGSYRILGRQSVDIIKTGGYKVSALEIEETLREHRSIAECAVVGVPDEPWGERVAACVVCRDGDTLTLQELRDWTKERLASYKAPSRLLMVDALPRNAMGKVQKPQVAKLFQDHAEAN